MEAEFGNEIKGGARGRVVADGRRRALEGV